MEPSGANKGFFQRQPVLKNQFYDDVSVQRIVKRKKHRPLPFPPPLGVGRKPCVVVVLRAWLLTRWI